MQNPDEPIATIQFTDAAEMRDMDNLETMVNERWHYEATVKISDGTIEVRRTDD